MLYRLFEFLDKEAVTKLDSRVYRIRVMSYMALYISLGIALFYVVSIVVKVY